MTQRLLLSLIAGILISAGILGCGEENAAVTRTQTIDIRNGTWLVARKVSALGDTSCAPRDREPTVEIWRCGEISTSGFVFIGNIDPGQGGTFGGFLCTVDQDTALTDSVYYDCDGRLNLGPCIQRLTLTGKGVVTDSTFNLVGRMTTSIEFGLGGDSTICAEYADFCTSEVVLSGSFLSTETASECDRFELFLPSSRTVGLLTAPQPAPAPAFNRELFPQRRRTTP